MPTVACTCCGVVEVVGVAHFAKNGANALIGAQRKLAHVGLSQDHSARIDQPPHLRCQWKQTPSAP